LVERIEAQNNQIAKQMTDLRVEHENQDAMRRDFTANVSHELKTPLTSIRGYAELIKTGIAKTDGEYVAIVERKEAIRYAIDNAQIGDVIVLAGKGHEDYQEIKGVKYDMDERVLIAEVVKESKRTDLIR
jgi:UDP-N-acetylmuramyl tripeptide synthase